MKTDDLIRAIVADLPHRGESMRSVAMKSLPAGIVLAVVLFVSFAGLRPGLAFHWAVVLPKMAVTMALAATALLAAMHLVRPEMPPASLFLILMVPVAILGALIVLELSRDGISSFQARAIGTNGIHCLTMIPLLSFGPLAAMLYAARAGAVTQHKAAGIVSGLAAAGIGASLYALYCTDDSMLFVGLWYSAAAILMAGIGAIACRIAVRW